MLQHGFTVPVQQRFIDATHALTSAAAEDQQGSVLNGWVQGIYAS